MVFNSELSPYYLKLYQQVAELPQMVNIRERILKDLREATFLGYDYSNHGWGNQIDINAKVRLGHETIEVGFIISGDETNFSLETGCLVSDAEVLDIFFEGVGRYGKPIRPHGLIKEETVRNGAEPRKKNAFAPWMKTRLLHSKECLDTKRSAQQRITREILACLKDDAKFNAFAEASTFDDIIDKFGRYAYLPPETLHRAIDMMYVKVTMEK